MTIRLNKIVDKYKINRTEMCHNKRCHCTEVNVFFFHLSVDFIRSRDLREIIQEMTSYSNITKMSINSGKLTLNSILIDSQLEK